MVKFSIFDYVNMYRVRGWRLVFEYFFYNHVFDILNDVDTHSWVPNQFKGDSIGDGEFYMATWSRDIIRSTKILINEAAIDASKFNFYDLGCGKGKVLLVWKSFFDAMHFKPRLFGVEYNNELIKICRKNLGRKSFDDISLIEIDANELKIGTKNNIFFLYNPFGIETLSRFLDNNIGLVDFVIYFNPVYADDLVKFGFEVIFECESYRNSSSFKILKKIDICQPFSSLRISSTGE